MIMGNTFGDLKEFLENAERLKRRSATKQQKNLTEEPEEYRDARRKAMRLLEHMDRTERGLREKLRQTGFSPRAVDYALAYVESYGYIDDERYARTYIAYRMDTKSRQKIIQELISKGIDKETAESAWEEEAALNMPDERKILYRTVEKKYSPDTELDEKEMRRLQGYLLRRGFSYSDIKSVLEDMNIRTTAW
ncbi:regulatory protein RecX [Ruminococcus sp. OM08-7]|nr:regulatory protein RecX [Ruminococcus sp. OM08-7]